MKYAVRLVTKVDDWFIGKNNNFAREDLPEMARLYKKKRLAKEARRLMEAFVHRVDNDEVKAVEIEPRYTEKEGARAMLRVAEITESIVRKRGYMQKKSMRYEAEINGGYMVLAVRFGRTIPEHVKDKIAEKTRKLAQANPPETEKKETCIEFYFDTHRKKHREKNLCGKFRSRKDLGGFLKKKLRLQNGAEK